VLTVKEKMTLDLEGTRFKYAGAKEQRIREIFNETPTRFYQRLNRILDDPAALAYDAPLVNRLRRLRDLRASARTS
jgi:ABC-type antimicrobial peptide transport system ATPase subunit